MAQVLIREFVRDLTRRLDFPDPVVEFGSMQVEPGQDGDLRPLFGDRRFVGTDMREGPGVDRVEDLRALRFADGEVGSALCLDTLEHCEDPPAACRELHRVVGEGGLCVISSVLLFGIHGYPNDYFRFTPEGFRSLLAPFDDVFVAGVGDPAMPVQVVGVGAKGRTLDLSPEQLPSLVAGQRAWDEAAGMFRLGVLQHGPREIAREVVRQGPRVLRDRARRALRPVRR